MAYHIHDKLLTGFDGQLYLASANRLDFQGGAPRESCYYSRHGTCVICNQGPVEESSKDAAKRSNDEIPIRPPPLDFDCRPGSGGRGHDWRTVPRVESGSA